MEPGAYETERHRVGRVAEPQNDRSEVGRSSEKPITPASHSPWCIPSSLGYQLALSTRCFGFKREV